MSLYAPTGNPTDHGFGSSAQLRSEFAAIAAAFTAILPSLAGQAGYVLIVNPSETGLTTVAALNGVPIGTTTPASGAFTTLAATHLDSTPIGAVTPSTGVFSSINSSPIGSTTPSSGAFTTLSSTGNTTIGDASADTLTVNATPNFLTNVGFNQSTAAQHLHVGSGTLATEMIRFQASGATLDIGVTGTGFEFKSTATKPFVWTSNSAVQMTLDTTGQLGIGASPSSKLDVFGNYLSVRDGTFSGFFGRGSDLVTGGATTDTAVRSGGGNLLFAAGGATEGFRLTTGGNLNIGGAGTTYRVNVNGDILLAPATTTTGALVRFTNGGGNAFVGMDSSTGGLGGTYTLNVWNGANTSLVFGTNNVEHLRLTQDGRLYGTALHNNAGAVTGATNQYIASGTYTPTLTNVGNAGSLGAFACQWMRVGNCVHVTGRADTTPASTTSTSIGITLPIASTLGTSLALQGAAGVVAASGYEAGSVIGDSTNNRATLTFTAASTSARNCSFSFMYQVL